VLGVAPPLYMSPYLGLAERAAELALKRARSRPAGHSVVSGIGELENALTLARLAWQDMVARSGEYQFKPGFEHTNAMLCRKTLLANAARDVVAKAVEISGGAAFYRNFPLERFWRDAQASHYHPLPEKRQVVFTGSGLLGLDVGEA
jgi:alkylation response protein AidB-like acyl-CoA dehydrogenase